MSRLVSVAADKGSVQLPNGVVCAGGDSTVLTDAQWDAISASVLVSGGTVLDGGVTTLPPVQGGSEPESDPVALEELLDLLAIATKTTGYTIVPSDSIIVSNGANLTHVLPSVTTATVGKTYQVKNIASTAAIVRTPGARTVTDGVTAESTALTSATAVFVAGDVGKTVTGAGISANTTIASRTSATVVVLSQVTTATATGVSVTIAGSLIDASPSVSVAQWGVARFVTNGTAWYTD